jgi:hypothetical protein
MTLFGDCVFAVAEGIPKLDCSIARAGDDLTVVSGEGDREDIVGVTNETASGDASGEFPQAKSLVPGR